MLLTYGTERECAIAPKTNGRDSYDAHYDVINDMSPDADDIEDADVHLGGGVCAYLDCSHVEITSPASDSLRLAVATERLIDKIERHWSNRNNVVAWKGNNTGNVTFGVHDNFIMHSNNGVAITTDDYLVGGLLAYIWLRQAICGEGGFTNHGEFYLSPRFALQGTGAVSKGSRVQVYSWDNCSPHSTAIRIGMMPCIYGLLDIGALSVEPDVRRFTGVTIPLNSKCVPKSIQKMGAELARIARLARTHIDHPRMPNGDESMSRMIDLWEEAAESVACGEPLPSIDWVPKWHAARKIYRRASRSGMQKLMIDWSRIDEPGIYYKLEPRIIPDLPYWTRLEKMRMQGCSWSAVRQLSCKYKISVCHENGMAHSSFDTLHVDGRTSNNMRKIIKDRNCVITDGEHIARRGTIAGKTKDKAIVKMEDTGRTVKVRPGKVFVY